MHHLTLFHTGEIDFQENKCNQLFSGKEESYLAQVKYICLLELQVRLQHKSSSSSLTQMKKEIAHSLVFPEGTSEK